jgi:hypothetical protein
MLFEKVQLEKGEQVLKVVRKHWFILAAELFAIFLMSMLPFLILFVLSVLPPAYELVNFADRQTLQVVTFATAGWLLLTFMGGYMIWTNYYLDVWIITDRRIIYIDQRGFFHRNVSMFRLERLHDIEISTVGIIQTFLNFGTLTAQTAGSTESNFFSYGLPDPRGLQALIQRATDVRINRAENETAGVSSPLR